MAARRGPYESSGYLIDEEELVDAKQWVLDRFEGRYCSDCRETWTLREDDNGYCVFCGNLTYAFAHFRANAWNPFPLTVLG